MATSGQTIYELTRNQIIEAAMRKNGSLARGQTPATEDYTIGQIALNALIAAYQGLGMVIWKRTDLSITPTANTDYTIGSGQTVNSPFPLNINYAYMQNTASGSKTEIREVSQDEFNQLNASSTGLPNQYMYVPKINKGVLSVWPKATTDVISAYTLHLVYQSPFEGFTTSTETADFPQEWQNPLIYGLALSLAPEYGVPLEDRKQLAAELKMFLDLATSVSDVEDSIFIQPDRTRN